MRVLGVDPSSTACGLAIVEDGCLRSRATWRRDANQPLHNRLLDFYLFMERFTPGTGVDVVAIEEVSNSLNTNTVRLIAYFESVAMYFAAFYGTECKLIKPMSARKIAVGFGGGKKEDAHERLRALLPQEKWATLDEADAIILAFAGGGWKAGEQ